jgi:Ca2+-binding RTX toxin-like protein
MGIGKTVLLLASMALAVLFVSGVAWALTKYCVAEEDFCVGTNQADTLKGSEEKDRIYGLKGNDTLSGNGGLVGGKGDDLIGGGEGSDTAGHGPGADKIYAEGGDDENLSSKSDAVTTNRVRPWEGGRCKGRWGKRIGDVPAGRR